MDKQSFQEHLLMLISMHGITPEDSATILQAVKWQTRVPMKDFDWKCPKEDSVGNSGIAFSLIWKDTEKIAIEFLEKKENKSENEIRALATLKDPLPPQSGFLSH